MSKKKKTNRQKLNKFQNKVMKKEKPSLKKEYDSLGKRKIRETIHRHAYHDEKDNAAIELTHKTENLVIQVGSKVVKSTKKTYKKSKVQKLTYKAEMDTLSAKYGNEALLDKAKTVKTGKKIQVTDKDIIKTAYKYGITSNSKISPQSKKLKLKSTMSMSALQVGSHVAVKQGQTLLGKGISKSVSGVKNIKDQAISQLRHKYESADMDNTGLQLTKATAEFVEPAGKYALQTTGRFVNKKVSNSFLGRTWRGARQGVRQMWANQQRRFLARHKGIAKARGVSAKAKAIVKEIISKSKPVILILAGILIIGILLQIIIAPIVAGLKSGAEAFITTTYPTENKEITASTEQWKELEMDLLERIEQIPEEFPGYDEYLYEISDFEHDPFELMAFLSAMELDFTHPDVQALIKKIFDIQNELEFVEDIETRVSGDGSSYEYKTLTTILEPKNFKEVVAPYLASKNAQEVFDLYMESGGNRQAFGNPLIGDWRGSISSQYGERPNPTEEGRDFHTGLDIRQPEGTPIHSVMFGEVVVAGWHDKYGNYVVIRDTDNNSSLYAHCISLETSVGQIVKKGDLIAKVGSTGNSTGNHLHIEIKTKGERVNPIFYISYGRIDAE